VNTVSSATKL